MAPDRSTLLCQARHVEPAKALPSRWAAIPTIAPMVTTPVPPRRL
jgi:hypothetical protein